MVSLKEIKSILAQAKEIALGILMKYESGWLGEEAEFKKVLNVLKDNIDDETKQLMETIIARNK